MFCSFEKILNSRPIELVTNHLKEQITSAPSHLKNVGRLNALPSKEVVASVDIKKCTPTARQEQFQKRLLRFWKGWKIE